MSIAHPFFALPACAKLQHQTVETSQALPDETMNTLNYFCLSRIWDRLEETEQPQQFVIRGPDGEVLKAALLKERKAGGPNGS